MNILTKLSENSDYSRTELELILTAWVLGGLFERDPAISVANGDVAEEDYRKQSIYSLLYAVYRAVGRVPAEHGPPYELTFNTWGYAWPDDWGPCPTTADDPQRFGRNAYTGLFASAPVKDYVATRGGDVHVIELGCGAGAGAHHVCTHVLQKCTYEAVDMQRAAIETCNRKFVPELGGRLVATHADCTNMSTANGVADLVAVCETHVAEMRGQVTPEDQAFFRTAQRVLKPSGLLVWGNAIPAATWQPCFEFLESIGLKRLEAHDVTDYAVRARDGDKPRVDAYVEHCLRRFRAFRMPLFGRKRRLQASAAMKNFFRNPGTQMYENMKNGTDSYRVAVLQNQA
jgi:ubiquinone/menaquinone biosynthesis C-methylase UbiE